MTPDQRLATAHTHSFALGDWVVDPKACLVTRGETTVKLRPQLVDVLVCLARRAGVIVLKDEILAEVWPGQYIAESGLSRCIAELRQILQDDSGQPRYIETITKRGYRLVAPVAWMAPAVEMPSATSESRDSTDGARGDENGLHPDDTHDAGSLPPATGSRGFGRRWTWVAGTALLLMAGGVAALALLVRPGAQAGILTDRDPVLLAFENKTADAVFDETIPLAVSIELEQSPYLALLSPARIQEVLRLMKRPPDTAITREVGLEICERAGARALIVTSIAQLGRQYVIGLEAAACGAGTVLARQQATTGRKEEVLAALRRAAREIRLAVGESAASVGRYQVDQFEATTASLDALRAVRRGDVARLQGNREIALGFYRQAAALDPDFALAHLRIARAGRGDEKVAALQKAYALRQRVTLPERLEIEASYYTTLGPDFWQGLQAQELLRQSYPRRASYRRDLSVAYINVGRYQSALTEALEAQRLEPDTVVGLSRVGRAHLYLNQFDEARAAMEKAVALAKRTSSEPPGYVHVGLMFCAEATKDAALAARERAWMAANPNLQSVLEFQAAESFLAGRLENAISLLDRLAARAAVQGDTETVRYARGNMARYEAFYGLEQRALGRIGPKPSGGSGIAAWLDHLDVAVWLERWDILERHLAEIQSDGPLGDWGTAMVRAYTAAVANGRGQPSQALKLLAPLQPTELGYMYAFVPIYQRARALYLTGDWAQAREAFQTILSHPFLESGRTLLPLARLGLARTLARAGDTAGSLEAYRQLLDQWRDADPNLPLIAQARREHAALSKQ